MAAVLALVFFVLPIAEIAVLVAVGDVVGIGPTILALIVLSIAGAVLAKRQGVEVWKRFRRTLSQGKVPSNEIVDGILILLGGALLLTPGFITDVLGMILLIPASRSVVKRLTVKASGWWIRWHFGLGAKQQHARVVEVSVGTPAPPIPPPSEAEVAGVGVKVPASDGEPVTSQVARGGQTDEGLSPP